MWVPQPKVRVAAREGGEIGAAPEGDAPPYRDPGPLVLEPSLGPAPARGALARVRTRGHDDVPPGGVEHAPGRRFVLDLLEGDDIRVERLDLSRDRREVFVGALDATLAMLVVKVLEVPGCDLELTSFGGLPREAEGDGRAERRGSPASRLHAGACSRDWNSSLPWLPPGTEFRSEQVNG